MARAFAPEAIRRLAEGLKAEGQEGIAAARELLDRGFGRPVAMQLVADLGPPAGETDIKAALRKLDDEDLLDLMRIMGKCAGPEGRLIEGTPGAGEGKEAA